MTWRDFAVHLWRDEQGFFQFLPMIAGAIGSIAGGAGKSSSDARQRQNELQAQRDRTAADLYGTRQGAEMQLGNLDLNRQQFSEQARGNRGRQALVGSLLQNFKPMSVSVPGIRPATITGGAADAIQGQGQNVGKLLYEAALMKMLQGDQFEGGKILNAPSPTPIKEAGFLEKLLGTAGLVGSLVGGTGAAVNAARQPRLTPPGTNVGYPTIP